MNEKWLLEKLRFISEKFFIIFTSAMFIVALIGTLPVHAEESQVYTYYLKFNMDSSSSWPSRFSYDLKTISSDRELGLVRLDLRTFNSAFLGENVSGYGYFPIYLTRDSSDTSGVYVASVDGSFIRYNGKNPYDTKNSSQMTFNSVFMENSSGNTWIDLETDMKIFDSVSSAQNYVLYGDESGIINKPESPDLIDEAYTFTGFTMNGKTASWTGTTQRSHLLDQDVEEYTTFTYGFASSEDQTVSSFIEYDGEYATADKKLKLPWDEMDAKKKDGEFIRQVNITPCYRVPGAFYRGVGAKVYFHKDGSIDKIELPSSSGTLSSDMERPIIVLNEGSNGKNPLEGDYSYFRFNNAQDDYYIEMKGRWYTTNDFDLYKENLVWKYKYQTILKNDLSTWVSVSDNVNSVGAFKFDVLGKASWENLLTLYPVDNRNYEGGSFTLMNKITGYSDALDTLKMLLKQPYSLYNGYEVYVRYYRYADDGGIQYSKWTHFYNSLANAGGSSGSRLDDLDNMYSESQSEKGLTDDQLSDLENSGNSRNDTDAIPKNNYDYSSLENATMNFFDMLKNYGSLLGDFPSMVASVFGFLPSWLVGFIGIAIGAVIVCRFIGR